MNMVSPQAASGMLSGANPSMVNSPIGQMMIQAASANPDNAEAQGAQARASGPAAGTPAEVPARQIMMPSDDISAMGPNFMRGRHSSSRGKK
jgi:hypothetical protein